MQRIALVEILLKIKMRHNCFCCARMHSHIIPWRESVTGHYLNDFKLYKQLVAENLGVDRVRADILLRNNLNIIGVAPEQIVKNCIICQNERVDLQGSIRDLKFLQLTEDDLENRILLLKEMGAEYINTAMLRTCASRAHVVTFKAYTKIPTEDKIADKLFSYLHTPPPDAPEISELNDYLTVKEYRKRCLSHWIQWKLEVPENNAKLIHSTFNKLRYKSFSRLKRCFDLLHDTLGLPIQVIREKKCLQHASSPDLENILTNIPVICGVPVKELLLKNLGLLKMKYADVLSAKEALEDFGITSYQLTTTPDVLVLNADSLKIGLGTIQSTPELKILIDHPSLLQMLMTKDGVQRRIDYLRYLSVNNASVLVLGKSAVEFDRYLRTGKHRLKSGELAGMLKKYFRKNIGEIEETVRKHPFWKHVDLLSAHNTLQYLLQSFDAEDIYRNLPLIFYAKEKVESSLTSLIAINNQLSAPNRYTPSQLLALCAYQIEREFHFTGDGVFDKSNQPKMPKSPDEFTPETEKSQQYQKNDSVNDVNISLFIKTNKTQRLP